MDRFDEINAFAAVADARSFTQAARRLGGSSAQVSKLVARLETRLGARLLNRTTRDVSLTDMGRAYLERARVLVDDFEARFPAGAPSLVGCDALTVHGDVRFGAGVVVRYDVTLGTADAGQIVIGDGTVLGN